MLLLVLAAALGMRVGCCSGEQLPGPWGSGVLQAAQARRRSLL